MEGRGKRSTSKTPASRAPEGAPRPALRRGRPPKFGRPSQVVALTLPKEALDALGTVHRDPGWAIVQLVEPILRSGPSRRRPRPPAALAELVRLPGRRSLIVVQPQAFTPLRGVSTIPLADGRAFLVFDHAGGVAELEVSILDQLEVAPARSLERKRLMRLRDIVRAWRHDPRLVFRTKSIIVVEGAGAGAGRPLATLETVDATEGAIVEGTIRRG
jgi:hypothetical protein